MTKLATISQRISAARQRAQGGGVPVRRKDADLYELLAECLGICEDVDRLHLHDAVRNEIRVSVDIRGQENAGKGRRYNEASADTYILVSRAVLEGRDNRNSVYRYASVLREAGHKGIASSALAKWLTENGGLNALYRTRRVDARKQTTRTLHLRDDIQIVKDAPFTLHLIRNPDGFYSVLGFEQQKDAAQ